MCIRDRVRPQSWLARIARRLDGDLLRYSDLVVTDTEAHAEFFRRLTRPKGKVARVWLSAETSSARHDTNAAPASV